MTGLALDTAVSVTKSKSEEFRLAQGVLSGGYGNVQVTMFWNTPIDLDLYVQDPSGEWVWFRNKNTVTGGHLDMDDQNGYSPENIFWKKNGAPNGTFKIVIENYASI